MYNMGVFVAIMGCVISVSIILFVLIFWIERILYIWEERWEFVRKLLVRKIIFRSKYRGTDSIFDLNSDIDTLNHLFFKYDLDDPYDRDEKIFVKEYKNTEVTNV